MKQFNKLTAIAALFTLAALRTNADTTNLVQNINIQLSAFRQGGTQTSGSYVTRGVDTSRIGTGAVIAALGAATGNSFSTSAQLVSVTPLPDGFSSIVIRDGANSVDVTAFFAHEQFGDTLHTGISNSRTGRSSVSDFSVQRFALHDVGGFMPLTLHFDVQGIAEDNDSSNGGVSSPGSNLQGNLVGTGDRNGVFLILQGAISVHGHDTEVVPGDPGDGGPNV
jgi:hypothetical protein